MKNQQLSEKILNALFDDEELNEMERKGAISCARGFRASSKATIELEVEEHEQALKRANDKLKLATDALTRINSCGSMAGKIMLGYARAVLVAIEQEDE